MKIYVSGGRGMVGSNVREHKSAEKHTLLTPNSSEVDLMDYNAVKEFLEKEKPDFIIHTAGLVGGIQANMNDLYGFLMSNITMGLNIIRAAKEVGIKNIINLSSSCVYPVEAPNPLKEEMFLTGAMEPTNEGYAIAKNVVMKACQYLNKEHPEFTCKTIVPVNLYGRYDKYGEHNSHMIPAVIKKIAKAVEDGDNEVEIWGTGKVRREFLYAGDLADFIWYCVNDFDNMPEVVNCSPGEDFSIDEFYEMISEVLGYKGGFTHNTEHPDGIAKKLTDNTKMLGFGWEPKTSFEDGIKQAYDFYKNEWRKK